MELENILGFVLELSCASGAEVSWAELSWASSPELLLSPVRLCRPRDVQPRPGDPRCDLPGSWSVPGELPAPSHVLVSPLPTPWNLNCWAVLCLPIPAVSPEIWKQPSAGPTAAFPREDGLTPCSSGLQVFSFPQVSLPAPSRGVPACPRGCSMDRRWHCVLCVPSPCSLLTVPRAGNESLVNLTPMKTRSRCRFQGY